MKEAAIAALLLVAFIAACAFQIATTSPVYDEPVHLASGYSYLRWNDYRLNPEHPPLVKQLAAIPLLFMDVTPRERPSINTADPSLRELGLEWAAALADPGAEWVYAHTFFFGLRSDALARLGRRGVHEVRGDDPVRRADYFHDVDRMFAAARSVVVLFGVALALLVYFWTRELFGPAGALLALAMFCFEPNLIAHSSVVTTDVPLALCMFGSAYFFWRSIRHPERSEGPGRRGGAPHTQPRSLAMLGMTWWANATAFVLFTASAFVVKFTAVVLVPVLIILLATRFSRRALALVGIAGAAAWLAIWAAYGFRYDAAADRNAASIEEADAGERRPMPGLPDRVAGGFPLDHALRSHAADATFYAEQRRVPNDGEAEMAYRYASIRGTSRLLRLVSHAKLLPEAYAYGLAFARQRSVFRPSYLRGRYSDTGFASYFFWTMVLKTPLVTLFLMGAGLALSFRAGAGSRRFLLVPVIVYVAVAMSSNLNIGHRHLLPILPFLFVLSGTAAVWARGLEPRRRVFVAIAILGTLAASSLTTKDRLAYVNALGGGPLGGYRSLVDSNYDWGQGLKALSKAVEPGKTINLSYFGTADPKYYGIRHRNLFLSYEYEPDDGAAAVVPGVVAVSATSLISTAPDSEISRFLTETGAEPEGRASPPILLYRVTRNPGIPR